MPTDDLRPISPSEAVELHLEAMKDDSAKWTRRSHQSHLRAFVEWCREDGGVDDMTELGGRDLFRFRVWRREGGYSKGQNDEIAPKTLDSALSVIRSFLRSCATFDAVPEDLYLKVPLLDLSEGERVSDTTMVPERVPPILEYLERYKYASRVHVLYLLMWHTGARLSGMRGLDLEDVELEKADPSIRFRHRPETDTPLKNDEKSERVNRISDRVAQTVLDYIEGPRVDQLDENQRAPLFTTQHGRISRGAVRNAFYAWTRPCEVGEGCPHDKDPETCEWTYYEKASKCPSSRSPHNMRKARVTKYRNDGVQRGVVSDRLDASANVLDEHYDRASEREKAARRWRQIQR
ncbi:tyrosine-type recombinase/integrase [Halobaculum rarum]|uniref:tyrosine-type recombinase/integrase n=1 Tax=Halobaculum rarum TaxID=3075122 RepID=UPI0032AE9861